MSAKHDSNGEEAGILEVDSLEKMVAVSVLIVRNLREDHELGQVDQVDSGMGDAVNRGEAVHADGGELEEISESVGVSPIINNVLGVEEAKKQGVKGSLAGGVHYIPRLLMDVVPERGQVDILANSHFQAADKVYNQLGHGGRVGHDTARVDGLKERSGDGFRSMRLHFHR